MKKIILSLIIITVLIGVASVRGATKAEAYYGSYYSYSSPSGYTYFSNGGYTYSSPSGYTYYSNPVTGASGYAYSSNSGYTYYNITSYGYDYDY